jgi:hypothetical protein
MAELVLIQSLFELIVRGASGGASIYRQRSDWDGAVIVGKRFCTSTLWRKGGLFDPVNEYKYRRNRTDLIYNIIYIYK